VIASARATSALLGPAAKRRILLLPQTLSGGRALICSCGARRPGSGCGIGNSGNGDQLREEDGLRTSTGPTDALLHAPPAARTRSPHISHAANGPAPLRSARRAVRSARAERARRSARQMRPYRYDDSQRASGRGRARSLPTKSSRAARGPFRRTPVRRPGRETSSARSARGRRQPPWPADMSALQPQCSSARNRPVRPMRSATPRRREKRRPFRRDTAHGRPRDSPPAGG